MVAEFNRLGLLPFLALRFIWQTISLTKKRSTTERVPSLFLSLSFPHCHTLRLATYCCCPQACPKRVGGEQRSGCSDPSAGLVPLCVCVCVRPFAQVERFLSPFKFVFPLKVFLLNSLIVFYGQPGQSTTRPCRHQGQSAPSSLPTITLCHILLLLSVSVSFFSSLPPPLMLI